MNEKKVTTGPVDWNAGEEILGLEQMMWRKRTIACRKFISMDETSVLDIGARNMYLRNILPDTVEYYPLDYKKRCDDTIICDLNKREFPKIKVDIAVCAGIIEYLNDLEWFFDQVTRCTDKIIITYRGKEKGYNTSLYTSNEIIGMLNRRGFILTDKNNEFEDEWPLIARFEKQSPKSMVNNYNCTGCGACVNACGKNAISFNVNNQGFYKPEINIESCVECGKCVDVCPELREVRKGNYSQEESEAFAAWADELTRQKSSSGGAFSVLAKEIIDRKGIVFGATYTEDFYVHHMGVRNFEDIELLRKSKYVQSNTEKTYREVLHELRQDHYVMYVGTPCQIAGLYSFLEKDYQKLLTVDLICFCVTPIVSFRKYLKENYNIETIRNITFRDKEKGWNPSGFSITFNDGKRIYKDVNSDDFQRVFHSVLCRNHVCNSCRYADFPRQADITLGDFWGIEQHDVTWQDGKGTSLIITNNSKGKDFIHNISSAFNRIQQIPIEWCRGKGNRIGNDGRPRSKQADSFLNMVSEYGFERSVNTILNKKYDIVMVCMHNHNYGNNLTNYALYQCLKDMGMIVAVVNRSLDAEWKHIKSDMAMYAHNPYASYDLIPDFATRMQKKQVNNWSHIFVVASDQLFRAEFIEGMDFHSCLDWVSSDKYMFSYGTSFGTDEFVSNNNVKGKTKYYLSRFNALSIREKTGVKLLDDEFGLQSQLVLDPVFLCSNRYYYKMAEIGKLRLPFEKYIGAYILDPSFEKENVLKKLEDKFGYRLNVISNSEVDPKIINGLWNMPVLNEALVEEWVANVCYCDLFVTDSFHGVCFALIFNKDFWVITEPGNWRGRARFESILSELGLEKRMIESFDELNDEMICTHINYDIVNEKITEMRKKSIDWLRSQIALGKEYKGSLQEYDIFDAKYDHTIQTNEKLREQVSHLENDTHMMEQKVELLVNENQRVEQKVEILFNENQQAGQKVEQLVCSYGKIQSALKELMNEQKKFFEENRRLNMQLSAVYNSTSWKVTKWLRWIKRTLMRNK